MPITREGETDTEGGFISLAASGRGESPIPARHNNYVCRRMKVIPRDKVSTNRGHNKLLNTFLKARKTAIYPESTAPFTGTGRVAIQTDRKGQQRENKPRVGENVFYFVCEQVFISLVMGLQNQKLRQKYIHSLII